MAGRVRHPIDQKALERYLQDNVPEIKTPLDIKQVRPPSTCPFSNPPLLPDGFR